VLFQFNLFYFATGHRDAALRRHRHREDNLSHLETDVEGRAMRG
jgi:hypothetical protein